MGNTKVLTSTSGAIILGTFTGRPRGLMGWMNTHHPRNREFKATVLNQDTHENCVGNTEIIWDSA